MRILTDCPEECRPLVPSGTDWKRLSIRDLPEDQRNLWRTVSEDEALYAARSSADFPIAIPCLAIIESAPSSQFTALSGKRSRGSGDLPPLAAVLALEGKGFRGQQDRSWVAERGNIHLSVYARPMRRLDELGAGLTMLPTVSVVDTVRTIDDGATRADIGIKWVNDVWADGRKISGVLSATHVHRAVVEEVIMGIGLNVEVSPDVEVTPFVPAVGCVAQCLCADLRWTDVLPGLLSCLAERYQELLRRGPGALLQRYREASIVVGRHVSIFPEGGGPDARPVATGIVSGLDECLGLEIAGSCGPISEGRLVLSPLDGSGD